MKIDEIKSMSVDDLWSLHDRLVSTLSRKLSEEKRRLDRRLRQLNGGLASVTKARRPYPRVLPKYRNPDRPSQTWAGRGKNHAGWSHSLGPAKGWTIFGFIPPNRLLNRTWTTDAFVPKRI